MLEYVCFKNYQLSISTFNIFSRLTLSAEFIRLWKQTENHDSNCNSKLLKIIYYVWPLKLIIYEFESRIDSFMFYNLKSSNYEGFGFSKVLVYFVVPAVHYCSHFWRTWSVVFTFALLQPAFFHLQLVLKIQSQFALFNIIVSLIKRPSKLKYKVRLCL